MIQLHLTSAKGRSEYDKMYYKIAYELQVKEVLPDGCSSVLYERTVQAFLHYILPLLFRKLHDYRDRYTGNILTPRSPKAHPILTLEAPQIPGPVNPSFRPCAHHAALPETSRGENAG